MCYIFLCKTIDENICFQNCGSPINGVISLLNSQSLIKTCDPKYTQLQRMDCCFSHAYPVDKCSQRARPTTINRDIFQRIQITSGRRSLSLALTITWAAFSSKTQISRRKVLIFILNHRARLPLIAAQRLFTSIAFVPLLDTQSHTCTKWLVTIRR